MTFPDLMRVIWRPGRGPTKATMVFAQTGQRRDDDELVAVADTPDLAVHIAAAHNAVFRLEA